MILLAVSYSNILLSASIKNWLSMNHSCRLSGKVFESSISFLSLMSCLFLLMSLDTNEFKSDCFKMSISSLLILMYNLRLVSYCKVNNCINLSLKLL